MPDLGADDSAELAASALRRDDLDMYEPGAELLSEALEAEVLRLELEFLLRAKLPAAFDELRRELSVALVSLDSPDPIPVALENCPPHYLAERNRSTAATVRSLLGKEAPRIKALHCHLVTLRGDYIVGGRFEVKVSVGDNLKLSVGPSSPVCLLPVDKLRARLMAAHALLRKASSVAADCEGAPTCADAGGLARILGECEREICDARDVWSAAGSAAPPVRLASGPGATDFPTHRVVLEAVVRHGALVIRGSILQAVFKAGDQVQLVDGIEVHCPIEPWTQVGPYLARISRNIIIIKEVTISAHQIFYMHIHLFIFIFILEHQCRCAI